MIILECNSTENMEALFSLTLVTTPVYLGWEGRNSRLIVKCPIRAFECISHKRRSDYETFISH